MLDVKHDIWGGGGGRSVRTVKGVGDVLLNSPSGGLAVVGHLCVLGDLSMLERGKIDSRSLA